MPQWLKWSAWSRGDGLTWRSQVGANSISIPHPTNLALFGHKITLYRFSQVHGLILLQAGSNRSTGARGGWALQLRRITPSAPCRLFTFHGSWKSLFLQSPKINWWLRCKTRITDDLNWIKYFLCYRQSHLTNRKRKRQRLRCLLYFIGMKITVFAYFLLLRSALTRRVFFCHVQGQESIPSAGDSTVSPMADK